MFKQQPIPRFGFSEHLLRPCELLRLQPKRLHRMVQLLALLDHGMLMHFQEFFKRSDPCLQPLDLSSLVVLASDDWARRPIFRIMA